MNSLERAQAHADKISAALAADAEARTSIRSKYAPAITQCNVDITRLQLEREQLLRENTCADRTLANYRRTLNFFTRLLPSSRRVVRELEAKKRAGRLALAVWDATNDQIILAVTIEREQLLRRQNSGLGSDTVAKLENDLTYWQTRALDLADGLCVIV